MTTNLSPAKLHQVRRLRERGYSFPEITNLTGLESIEARRIMLGGAVDFEVIEARLEREKLCDTARRWYRRETPPSWWRYKPDDYWPCVRANFADVLPEAA